MKRSPRIPRWLRAAGLCVLGGLAIDLFLGRTEYADLVRVLEVSDLRERAGVGQTFVVSFERQGRFSSLSTLLSWDRTEAHREEYAVTWRSEFEAGTSVPMEMVARLRRKDPGRRPDWLEAHDPGPN